jgi:hypothetical protein
LDLSKPQRTRIAIREVCRGWRCSFTTFDLPFGDCGATGFTLTAIATLALTIGLNVTVFTVVSAMLFRGFPLVQRNDRLVYMQERYPAGMCCASYTDFEAWRAQAHSFVDMGFIGGTPITFSDGNGRPMDMSTATVSTNTFGLLGVAPVLGRDFVRADQASGAPIAVGRGVAV